MRLAKDNFFIGSFNFRRTKESQMETIPQYSYEAHNAMYDIIVLDRHKYYSVNGGQWYNTIDHIMPIHVEIERHFGI